MSPSHSPTRQPTATAPTACSTPWADRNGNSLRPVPTRNQLSGDQNHPHTLEIRHARTRRSASSRLLRASLVQSASPRDAASSSRMADKDARG
jgi:hypothetical protein